MPILLLFQDVHHWKLLKKVLFDRLNHLHMHIELVVDLDLIQQKFYLFL